jgi:hypothetical protein
MILIDKYTFLLNKYIFRKSTNVTFQILEKINVEPSGQGHTPSASLTFRGIYARSVCFGEVEQQPERPGRSWRREKTAIWCLFILHIATAINL